MGHTVPGHLWGTRSLLYWPMITWIKALQVTYQQVTSGVMSTMIKVWQVTCNIHRNGCKNATGHTTFSCQFHSNSLQASFNITLAKESRLDRQDEPSLGGIIKFFSKSPFKLNWTWIFSFKSKRTCKHIHSTFLFLQSSPKEVHIDFIQFSKWPQVTDPDTGSCRVCQKWPEVGVGDQGTSGN